MLINGQIATYMIILSSLLWHEMGHLVMAVLCHIKVKSCTIAPYGGEIEFAHPATVQPSALLWIALGGPMATIVGIGLSLLLPELLANALVKTQLILLCMNICPLIPLDGGRIVLASLYIYCPSTQVIDYYYGASLVMATCLLLGVISFLPHVLFLIVVCLFIWLQAWKEWRYRKYRLAFEKYAMKRLT
ncbi:site-2 protease family protein [Lysinibacillus piscis]|nr:site-2 protease family protein [Lysinibacillus sp. KH24]